MKKKKPAIRKNISQNIILNSVSQDLDLSSDFKTPPPQTKIELPADENTKTKMCITCKAPILISAYPAHIIRCLQEQFTSNKARAKVDISNKDKAIDKKTSGEPSKRGQVKICQICQQDLTSLSQALMADHINLCLDQVESNKQSKSAINNPNESKKKIPDCDICGKAMKTQASRKAHVKRCAKKFDVPATMLRERGKEDKAALMPLHQFEEETQLALAISTSLRQPVEETEHSTAQEHPPGTASDTAASATKDAFSLLMSEKASAQPGPRKRHRHKQTAPSLLLTRSAEEGRRVTADKLAALLLPQATQESEIVGHDVRRSSLSKTPSGNRTTFGSLWEHATHPRELDSQQRDKRRYYVTDLMPLVEPSSVATGSLMRRLSNLCGYTTGDAPETPGGKRTPAPVLSVHDSTMFASTQTALCLAEMVNDRSSQQSQSAQFSHSHITMETSPAADQGEIIIPIEDGDEIDVGGCGDVAEFEIEAVVSPESQPGEQVSKPVDDSVGRLIGDLASMINNPLLSDISFATRTSRIHCHKFILHARCGPDAWEWLKELSTVDLSEFDEGPAMTLLNYIYTGDTRIETDSVYQFGQLCDRFDLPALKSTCNQHKLQSSSANYDPHADINREDIGLDSPCFDPCAMPPAHRTPCDLDKTLQQILEAAWGTDSDSSESSASSQSASEAKSESEDEGSLDVVLSPLRCERRWSEASDGAGSKRVTWGCDNVSVNDSLLNKLTESFNSYHEDQDLVNVTSPTPPASPPLMANHIQVSPTASHLSTSDSHSPPVGSFIPRTASPNISTSSYSHQSAYHCCETSVHSPLILCDSPQNSPNTSDHSPLMSYASNDDPPEDVDQASETGSPGLYEDSEEDLFIGESQDISVSKTRSQSESFINPLLSTSQAYNNSLNLSELTMGDVASPAIQRGNHDISIHGTGSMTPDMFVSQATKKSPESVSQRHKSHGKHRTYPDNDGHPILPKSQHGAGQRSSAQLRDELTSTFNESDLTETPVCLDKVRSTRNRDTRSSVGSEHSRDSSPVFHRSSRNKYPKSTDFHVLSQSRTSSHSDENVETSLKRKFVPEDLGSSVKRRRTSDRCNKSTDATGNATFCDDDSIIDLTGDGEDTSHLHNSRSSLDHNQGNNLLLGSSSPEVSSPPHPSELQHNESPGYESASSPAGFDAITQDSPGSRYPPQQHAEFESHIDLNPISHPGDIAHSSDGDDDREGLVLSGGNISDIHYSLVGSPGYLESSLVNSRPVDVSAEYDDDGPVSPCLGISQTSFTSSQQRIPDHPHGYEGYKTPSRSDLASSTPGLMYDPPTDIDTDISFQQQPTTSAMKPAGKSKTKGSKSKKKRGKPPNLPSPFTPMPDYKNMKTPGLKNNCKRYGMKALPKKKMISVLTGIYQGTHQYETDSDVDEALLPLQKKNVSDPPPTHSSSPPVSEKNKKGSSKGVNKGKGKRTTASRNLMKERNKESVDEEAHGGSGLQHVSEKSQSDMSDDDMDSQGVPEESMLCEAGATDGPPVSQRDAASKKKIVWNYIKEHEEIYTKALLYEPLEFDQFHELIKGTGHNIGTNIVMDALDDMCIQFTMRGKEKKPRQRKRRGASSSSSVSSSQSKKRVKPK